ncbi:ALDH-like protein [Plenodomus tracheiphilus IPT5]|uniref:ALDH-like protein n=1 Tax=Plenodomus tracheiphilus IPT5 TaxID=1408161 RepID=A0A6A7AUC4_9PLEO|nr:ALDH-like protein [Plenodomus tracheiphilus IPT5]
MRQRRRIQHENSIVGAAFEAAGQQCMALSVLVTLPETKEWVNSLVEEAKQLKVDGGFESDVDVAPVVSAESRARIEEVITAAEEEGATILLDGRNYRPATGKYSDGIWIGPTIITGVKPHMRCYTEEIFGPVRVCVDAKDVDDAIHLINANEYGNGVAIFTSSGAGASYFSNNIKAGQVGVNMPIPVPLSVISFTGNKRSVAGGGISTFYGKPAWNFYTLTKTITSLWRRKHTAAAKASVNMSTQS